MIATNTNSSSALKVLAIEADPEVIAKIRAVFHAPTVFNHGTSIEAARDFLQAELYDLIFLDVMLGGNARKGIMLANELLSKQYGKQGHVFLLTKTELEDALENELTTLQRSGQLEILHLKCLDDPLIPEHRRLQYIYQCLNDSVCRHRGATRLNSQPDGTKAILVASKNVDNSALAVIVIASLLLGWAFIPDLLSRRQLGSLVEMVLASLPAFIVLTIFRTDLLDKIIPFLPAFKSKQQ